MTIEMQVTSERPRPDADSVERTLEVVGDAWTFRVLREAFFGVRRFDAFRENTGAAPNVLTDRLKKLVHHGVFEKKLYSAHRTRFEYRLTERGLDLYPIVVMMMRWGDRWLDDGGGPPLTLIHERCGSRLEPALRCGACEEPIDARQMSWRGRRTRRRRARRGADRAGA